MEYLFFEDTDLISPLCMEYAPGRPGPVTGGGSGSGVPPWDEPGACPCRTMYIR